MPLRNEDYTDLELLHIVNDVAIDGLASTEEVALKLGFDRPGKASGRLSWMARFDMLEKVDGSELVEPTNGTYWRITDFGWDLMRGRVKKAALQAIEEAGAGGQVLMMRELSKRVLTNGSAVRTAVRREYLHHQAKSRH